MDKRLTKGLVAVIGIMFVSVCLARGCTNSETIADYAVSHSNDAKENVEPDIEYIDKEEYEEADITGVVQTSDNEKPVHAGEEQIASNEENAASQRYFYIEEISDDLKSKMDGKSYAEGIDESVINYSMLRHVVIKYYDFNNEVQTGELVCNEKIAQDLLEIFEELYDSGYQLERVHLIDEYDADDDASMDANNTSCFNYRVVDNTTKLSYHAYGLAIDINPFYNPYVQMRNGEEYICPSGSVPYANREDSFPYKIDASDLAYRLFKQHGFIWGGDWNSCKDYQHFEKRVE